MLCVVFFFLALCVAFAQTSVTSATDWGALSTSCTKWRTQHQDAVDQFEGFENITCLPEDVKAWGMAKVTQLRQVLTEWNPKFDKVFDDSMRDKNATDEEIVREGLKATRHALEDMEGIMRSNQTFSCQCEESNHTRIYNVTATLGNEFIVFTRKGPMLTRWQSNRTNEHVYYMSHHPMYLPLTFKGSSVEFLGEIWDTDKSRPLCMSRLFVSEGNDSLPCKPACQRDTHWKLVPRKPDCVGDGQLIHQVKCVDFAQVVELMKEYENCSRMFTSLDQQAKIIRDANVDAEWKNLFNSTTIMEKAHGKLNNTIGDFLRNHSISTWTPEEFEWFKRTVTTFCFEMRWHRTKTAQMSNSTHIFLYNYTAPVQVNITIREETVLDIAGADYNPHNDSFTRWRVDQANQSSFYILTQSNGEIPTPVFVFKVNESTTLTQEVWGLSSTEPRLTMQVNIRPSDEDSLQCYKHCNRSGLNRNGWPDTRHKCNMSITDPVVMSRCTPPDILAAGEKMNRTWFMQYKMIKESAAKLARGYTFHNVSEGWRKTIHKASSLVIRFQDQFGHIGSFFDKSYTWTWANLNATAGLMERIIEQVYASCIQTSYAESGQAMPVVDFDNVTTVKFTHNNKTMNFSVKHDVLYIPPGYLFTLRKSTPVNLTALTRWTNDKGSSYYGDVCDSNSQQFKNGRWYNTTIVEQVWVWKTGPHRYKNIQTYSGTTYLEPIVVRVVKIVPRDSLKPKHPVKHLLSMVKTLAGKIHQSV